MVNVKSTHRDAPWCQNVYFPCIHHHSKQQWTVHKPRHKLQEARANNFGHQGGTRSINTRFAKVLPGLEDTLVNENYLSVVYGILRSKSTVSLR